jgi:hypothetical protein
VELAIEHDQSTGCWQLLGDASEVRQSERDYGKECRTAKLSCKKR